MQSIHHVIMATLKGLINSVCLQYRELGGCLDIVPTVPVVVSRGVCRTKINTCETHRNCASGKLICTQIPAREELNIENADSCPTLFAFRHSKNRIDQRLGVRTIIQVYGG